MKDGYLSTKHATEYLDMSPSAFGRAVRKHGIPHGRIGRLRRFRKDTLDRVLATMALRPTTRRGPGSGGLGL